MKKILYIAAVIFSSCLISCSASKQMSKSTDRDISDPNNGGFELVQNTTNQEQTVSDFQRKILFSAYMTLAVQNVDSSAKAIEKIATKYKGYISETGTERVVIRVDKQYFDKAVEEISKLGKLQSKSISGQDVTNEYYDNKIRLENAEKARNRYLELLAKAENIESALMVERELERLNREIDLLKGQMNRVDQLTAYSTITVNIHEKKKPGLIGYIFVGLYHTVKWFFVRN